MLRALLRVGQRAVRIQLEQARISGQDLSPGVGRRVPVGGIPGFWVEKTGITSSLMRDGAVGKGPVKDMEVVEVSAEEERQVVKVEEHPVSVQERPIRDIQEDPKSGTDASRMLTEQETEEPTEPTSPKRKIDVPPSVVAVAPTVPAPEPSQETATSLKHDVSHSRDLVSETKSSASDLREVKRLEERIPLREVAGVGAGVIPEVQVEEAKSGISEAEASTAKEPTANAPLLQEPVVEETSPEHSAVEEPEIKTPQTAVELDDVEQRPVRLILPLRLPLTPHSPK
jgi:hypothetical protein